MSKRIITNYGTDIATTYISDDRYNQNINKYIRVYGNSCKLNTYAVIIADCNRFAGY